MKSKCRKRTCPVWSPKWDDTIRGWTAKFIKKNIWRCDKIHEMGDLMNDAYLTFAKVAERYPRVIEPQHFMALYKTCLRNTMHDHSRYMRAKAPVHQELALDVSELYDDRIGEVTNQGPLYAALSKAPPELKSALAALGRDPEQVRTTPKGHLENLNMRLSRVVGYRGYDFTGQLKELLT